MTLSSSFLNKYGPWAVVTGASSGIGVEFARQLAEAGLSVVLVARRKDRLEAVEKEILEKYPVKTKVIVADLASEQGRADVASGTADLDIGLLVNNAGVEAYGSFYRDSLETHMKVIDLNVSAVTALAYSIGGRLVSRGRGGIIFVSSLAAHAFPWFASYSASKSFVTALSLTLREELKEKGVDVLAVEPGAVVSEMSDRVTEDVDFSKMGFNSMSAEECVSETLQALLAKKARVVPGFMNKISLFLMGLIPQQMLLTMMNYSLKNAMKPELTGA